MTWAAGSDHRAHRAASGARPDLVDLLQVSHRLGLRSAELRRRARDGSLPGPHYRFHSVPVWHWPTLVESLQTPRADGPRRLRPPAIDLLSLSEVAARLSIPPSELRSLLRAGDFPPPDYQFSKGDAWLWPTARAWRDNRDPLDVVRSTLRRAEAEHLAAWRRLADAAETSAASSARAGQEILDRFDALSGRLERLAGAWQEAWEPAGDLQPADPERETRPRPPPDTGTLSPEG